MSKTNGSHKTLVSLAILKSDLDDERRDYLGYIESFVIPVLRRWPDEPVTDGAVAREFEREYGLRVPDRTIQLILRRLARQKYLERSHGVFHISRSLPDVSLEIKRNAASKHISNVFQSLRDYAKKRFEVSWDDDDVESAILGFLDRFGVDCLRAYIFRTALPALPAVPETAPSDQFITGSFIKNANENNKGLFESLIVLIKGQMYSNALTCPDLEGLDKDFKGITFYLDTPLLPSLLNLQGGADFESVFELVALLRRLRGKVAYFEHTAAELESVLKASADNIENSRATGRVVREMRRLGLKKGDITLKISGYERELKEYGVTVKKTPEYQSELQIDESALGNEIGKHINYKHSRAREYDINSIRSIFILRRGMVPRRLEDCGSVLVTNNDGLSKAAFSFGRSHNSAREVSPVITDFSLANIAWLKSPMDAPGLPIKETIAACYAAMEPSSELWDKYLSELDKLEQSGEITVDDHAVLRVSEVSEQALMDLTLGDDRMLKSDTVSAILSRVKDELAAEHTVEVSREKEAHANTRRQLRMEQERRKRLDAKIASFSSVASGGIYFVFLALVCVVLFLGMMAGSGVIPVYVKGSKFATALLNTSIIVAVVVALYSTVFGSAIQPIVNSWRRKLERRLSYSIKKWFGVDVD